MTTTNQTWIGQNGKQYGPYGEAQIRQWLKEGKLAPDAVAWRDGMADWVPIAQLFPAPAADQPPQPPVPPAPPPFASSYANTTTGVFSARTDDYSSATNNTDIPTPPSLHWALIWLFAILTFGIFGLVWPFIQANWVRKIDSRSNAMLLLGLATGCLVVGYPMYFASLASLPHGGGGTISVAGLLLLASWVLYLVAFFSMAGSMRDKLASRELPLEIGGVTLFFFTMYYLQGQLSWVARWKRTGQVTPRAPKGVFWALFCIVPFVIAILAAITIPAYQGYINRAEISQGAALASGAKVAVAEYYNNHGELPANNAAAGLAEDTSISGKYVSGVSITDGRIMVTYRTLAASRSIRDKVLVLTPQVDQGSITWSCGDSTIPYRELPRSCRQ
ncbi:pilin [Rhodanobacter sp. 115]|uniref:pilin n=1 Tax=Rhodanobacter sp. FW021-MT20 TaxID=1162282 RepID=UPI0034E46602